jgi:hypothetical protein
MGGYLRNGETAKRQTGDSAKIGSPFPRFADSPFRPLRWPVGQVGEALSNGATRLFLEENRKIFIRCSVAHTKGGIALLGDTFSPMLEAHGGGRTYSLFNLSKVTPGSVKGSLPQQQNIFTAG